MNSNKINININQINSLSPTLSQTNSKFKASKRALGSMKSVNDAYSYMKGDDFPLIDGTYKGDVVEGVREGYGCISWSNGDMYEGDFKDGLRDGKGSFTSVNGYKYTGEWKRSEKSGRGEEMWPNGRRVFFYYL